MPESLLDECYGSILKIAETQSHEGKRAILALAEMFQDSEAVDGGSEHGARHMHRVMAGVWKMAGSIEHDGDLTVGIQLHERGCRPRR